MKKMKKNKIKSQRQITYKIHNKLMIKKARENKIK